MDSGITLQYHNMMPEDVSHTIMITHPNHILVYVRFDNNSNLIASCQSNYDTTMMAIAVSSPTTLHIRKQPI